MSTAEKITHNDDLHQSSIANNLKHFDSKFVSRYDEIEGVQTLSHLIPQSLLQFDVAAPRAPGYKTSQTIGDPSLPCSGVIPVQTQLPVSNFAQRVPHSLFKPGIKIIDFACGTGILTEKFAPYLSSSNIQSEIVGIDINDNSLGVFNQRAKTVTSEYQGLSMKSINADILDLSNETKLTKLILSADVIICTLSYHHLHSYQDISAKLATFLKPGGWLLVYDFYNEDLENTVPTNAKVSGAVSHMGGLSKNSLNTTLSDKAKLVNVSSAREMKVWLWQPEAFIRNHCPQTFIDQLNSGVLKKKDNSYLVPTSLILAVGQRASD